MRRKKAFKRGRCGFSFGRRRRGICCSAVGMRRPCAAASLPAPRQRRRPWRCVSRAISKRPRLVPGRAACGPSYQLAAESTVVIHDANRALFAPEPMVPAQRQRPQAAQQPARHKRRPRSLPVQVADLSSMPPVAATRAAAAPILPKPRELAGTPKPHRHRCGRGQRPGYMLDDAQLASIKRRLN